MAKTRQIRHAPVETVCVSHYLSVGRSIDSDLPAAFTERAISPVPALGREAVDVKTHDGPAQPWSPSPLCRAAASRR